MAELPSPHSIAIGTLISLYADANSPIFVYDNFISDEENSDQHRHDVIPAVRWQLELSRLIQKLVMREEDGLFALLPSNENDNPAAAGYNLKDPNDVIEFDRYSRHDLDMNVTDDFLNDILGSSFELPQYEQKGMIKGMAKIQDYETQKHHPEESDKGAPSPLRIQTLSSLFDSIDDAFYNLSNGAIGKSRSPPSKALLSRLQMASSSIDDLINLLDEWHALLDGSHIGYPMPGVKPSSSNTKTVGVDGESTFGVLLRKLCLGLEEIPFEAMSRLWMAFKGEVDDEAASGLARNIHSNQQQRQMINNNVQEWLPSSPQIERLIRRTCLDPNLETYLRKEPSHITAIMEELQETHPECPSISFFLFLSSLFKGERTQALENLHRYFDYAMINERRERAERAVMLQLSGGPSSVGGNSTNNNGGDAAMRTTGMGGITNMASGMGGITGGMTGGVMNGMINNNAAGGGGRGGNNAQSDAKIYKESNVMEYAAILLAQMHYRFGFSRLSLQATEEAVRVAQQSGDDECVSFANGWLALASSSIGVGGRVNRSIYATVGGLPSIDTLAQPGSRRYRPLVTNPSNFMGRSTMEEESMLQNCQTRATQRGLTSLSVGAALELARRTVYRRDANDQLCSNESELFPTSTLAWDRIQRSGTGSSPSFVDNRQSAGAALASNRSGGQVHTDIGNMTASEAIGIMGRQALAESGLWDSTGHTSFASLSSCRTMYGDRSNEALRRVLSSLSQGPCRGGSDEGSNVFVGIMKRIEMLSDEAAAPTPEWLLSLSAFTHELSVRSYDFSTARNLQNMIANHLAFPFNSLSPVETALLLMAKSTHLFLQQEDYERAKATARQACWLSSRHSLFFHQGWNLLQLALIDLEASTSSSSNVESSMLPLLECLHLSEQYAMDPLRATALSILSRVFLCMGRFCKARALINAAMPLLMQHGHVWFQGEACLTLAKCHLSEVVSSDETRLSATQLRQNALIQLEKAASLFERIEDFQRLKQVYYLQSRIHPYLPNGEKRREEAAKKFLKLHTMKQLKIAGKKQWDTMYGVFMNIVHNPSM